MSHATTVESDRLYSFSEACQFIPSSRGGNVNWMTLYRWRRQGLIKAVCRQVGKRKSWFIWGSELQRVLIPSPVAASAAPDVQTVYERNLEYEQAVAKIKAMRAEVQSR